MQQLESQIGAADLTLDGDLLDRIDRIVPPGHTIKADDAGYLPPALTDPAQRRRPHR